MENFSAVISFYEKCLTVIEGNDPTVFLNEILADDFKSKNAAGEKTKQALIAQIAMFWKIMPDMKWEIQEIIHEGNQIVVRSLFGASPTGNFKGVPCDGSKKFTTMAIDIHTVENGKIKQVYHCEEWETAIEQLKNA